MDAITQALTAARETFRDPTKWTRGVLARDRSGTQMDPLDTAAACRCSLGEIEFQARSLCIGESAAEHHNLFTGCVERLGHSARGVVAEGGGTLSDSMAAVIRVNDHLGYDAAMRMFDLAISEAA